MLITAYCIEQHQPSVNKHNSLITIPERTSSQNGSDGTFDNF